MKVKAKVQVKVGVMRIIALLDLDPNLTSALAST